MTKVLFLAQGTAADYMCDMLYHGLMSRADIDVEEINPPTYMHDSFAPHKGCVYGRGFTVFARLSSETMPQHKISVEEMLDKVKDKYYDFVIYGSIHRFSEHIDYISSVYEKSKLLIIDGEDHPFIEVKWTNMGTYFKRENQTSNPQIRPISFAIPKELIVSSVPPKDKILAHIIAGDRSTYIYEREEDYFADYQRSLFGHTTQKGGWDCCRHYEILMNGCIPYFPNLEKCPPRTMMTFPKDIVLSTNKLYASALGMHSQQYAEIINGLLEHARTHNTTDAMVSQVLFSC